METMNCKNCENAFTGNFCNNCGQTAHTHAIGWHYLGHDIQHGIFHFDKGIFYTIRQLYTRPGAAIREFIEGKRVQHLKPVSFVFMLATLYGLLYHYLHINIFATHAVNNDKKSLEVLTHINEWVSNHYAITALLFIPIYSLGTYIAFRKKGYNFIEHIVLNCFITGQKLIFQFLFLPLYYIFSQSPVLSVLTTVVLVLDFAVSLWVYTSFFRCTVKEGFFRTILVYILFYALFLRAACLPGFCM